MTAATLASFPSLRLPRPALELLAGLGPGFRELSVSEAAAISGKPRSTVARWLSELVEERVILRIRRDEYAVPSSPTQALLLNETSEYARSLLLHQEVLSAFRFPHAFACVSIRRAFPLSLVDAVPVLNLSDKRVLELTASEFPTAFRAHYTAQDRRFEELRFPTAAADQPEAIPRKFPVLSVEMSLALFAATADSRVVNAALAAAGKLGVDAGGVTKRAASFVIEKPPIKGSYPNTLVFPRWLSSFHTSATGALGREFVRRDAKPPSHVTGEDS
ncbi:MAG: helix-turn-helix domain-containing protein [Candidatus Thermoplasmatota archaeon]